MPAGSAADPLAHTSGPSDLLSQLAVLERRPTLEESLPGWSTVRQLGHGSHGRCFLMKKPDGSLIVHKRVPVSHMRPAEQEAAEREVNILAALNHPFIIRYDRAFVRQGQLCIAMEHAAGGDLFSHLRGLVEANKRLDASVGLDWFVQLALALSYVHRHKVLHRDIALKNVFLADGGVVKLGDFGVARVLESTQELASTKVGTPCYIAPERCEGRAYSYEADMWAMGCLLFELLTTRPAFSADTIPQVTAQILAGSYAPYHESDEGVVPGEVRGVIAKLLSVPPEQRPSIHALLDEPALSSYAARHASVRETYTQPQGRIGPVEIPLIGYEGASKTKFSERPVFVDGGDRIVDEANLSAHEEKLLGARQRRQRQLAEKRGTSGGSSSNSPSLTPTTTGGAPNHGVAASFGRVQNFGSGGVVGFLVQSGATGSATAGAAAPTSGDAGS